MSSVLRSKSATPSENTRWVNITTPSYLDESMRMGNPDISGTLVPIPYTVNNGVLDINIQDDIINSLYEFPEMFFYDQFLPATYKVKLMGGSRPVTSLGPTILDFIYSFTNADEGSVAIHTAPVMTKIQSTYNAGDGLIVPLGPSEYDLPPFGFASFTLGSGTSYGVTYLPPNADYISGTGVNDKYRTSWVFKTPLTIKYTNGGDPLYWTFSTTFDVPAAPLLPQFLDY